MMNQKSIMMHSGALAQLAEHCMSVGSRPPSSIDSDIISDIVFIARIGNDN